MPRVSSTASGPRKPRADAARNRRQLLDAARLAFAERGARASLEEIARAAGVGIGTLYRHFPTRDSLVEQVYRDEAAQLAEAAQRLATELPPMEALRRWLLLFVDYMITKRSLTELLNALPAGPATLYASSTALVKDAVTGLVDRAAASGATNLPAEPLDLLRALAGVANIGASSGWRDNARNLVDILIAGIGSTPKT